MQKSEGVVILMQQNFRELEYVVGSPEIFSKMSSLSPMSIFDSKAIAFLNALSCLLMKKGNAYSDVITFAFWCRKVALMHEKQKYNDGLFRLGKGIAFHSTPSNVPVNFAFSLAAGVLAGNANIIRLPAKKFEQVDIICAAINELLDGEYLYMKPYLLLVKFPTIKEIMEMFSEVADVRVVWGGDMTISHVRESALKPRANEITFADRQSICVIDADYFLESEFKDKIIQDFYNDTYFSDQNACTSPKFIFWKGSRVFEAKKTFWAKVSAKCLKEYHLSAVHAIGKLANFYKAATVLDIKKETEKNNFITRLNVKTLSPQIWKYKYHSGFFFEYNIENLSEILPVCDEKCQTMTYLGIDKKEINEFLALKPKGIDRIVPLGKSMDFSLLWDGHDLIGEMSRIITVL